MRLTMATLLALVLGSTLAAAQSEDVDRREYYHVTLRLTQPDAMDDATTQSHVGYLQQMYDAGSLYMAGPFMDGDSHEGVCIYLASSAEETRALAAGDPTVQSGKMEIVSVREWWAAFNKPEGVTFSLGATDERDSAADAQAAAHAGAMPEMVSGGSNFIEFPSSDLAATQEFYGTLFGWTFDEMDMGDGTDFAFFMAPGGLAGAFTTAYTPTRGGAVLYINCEGVGATLERISAAGGAVELATMELPMGLGYIAHFTDNSGNLLGLWSATP